MRCVPSENPGERTRANRPRQGETLPTPDAPPRCPLCGADRGEQVSKQLRPGFDERFAMRPYRCAVCSLVFLHPLFSEAGEADFYRHAFRELYHGPGYDLAAFHERGGVEARRRVAMLAKGGLLRGRVLEIGSASGYFLEAAACRTGVECAMGVELDEEQRHFARCRGLECVASVDEIDDQPFDLIVLFHVLEHLRDPVAVLRDLADRLAPGGVIVVEVPNVDDALLGTYRIPEFVRFYWHPAHSLYFSPATLERAARQAGLGARVEPLQRYTLSNHLHWAVRREPGGQRWLEDLISPETEAAYAADLCRRFVCDSLWMIARPDDEDAT